MFLFSATCPTCRQRLDHAEEDEEEEDEEEEDGNGAIYELSPDLEL